jgi:hypothetical protein
VLDEILVRERVLVLEQPIVHVPEPALRTGGLGRLGRAFRVRVDLRQREVTIDEAQRGTKRRSDLLEDEMGGTAVRALEVPVLEQRDRRVHRAADVISLTDRQRQARGTRAHDRRPPSIVSSASRMPSAPGFTPIGET